MYIERAKQMGLQTIMLSQVTPLLVMVESCYLLPVFFGNRAERRNELDVQHKGRQEVKYQEFLNLTYVGCRNKKARRAPPAHSGTYVGYITGTNN